MSAEGHLAGRSPVGGPVAGPRLDWRFLLADPELDRVAYVGNRDAGLSEWLRLSCRSVDVLDTRGVESGEGDATGEYEVVIACEPSESELGLAAGQVRPGGTLVVEARGPVGALTAGIMSGRGARWRWRYPRSPSDVVRRVSELGFEAVRSYWHWPSFDRCTRITPLDDRAATRYTLSRAGRGTRARAGAWLGRRLLGMGLLGWGVDCVSVIGRRAREPRGAKRSVVDRGAPDRRSGPEPAAQGLSVVLAFLDDRWDHLGLDRHLASRRPSFVVLTPQFRNSSHLIFLLLPESGGEPVLVAKVPRVRGRCAKLEREAERLREIQGCRPSGFESIPRLVAFEAYGDRMILLETAMRGRAMDRGTVRRRTSQCCEATLDWIIEVQTATRLAVDPGGNAFERLIERELLDVQAILPTERGFLERTRELVLPLSRANLPLVLEHGDLSHPNLLVGPQGRVAVVDWEQAELHGLPASDLFFFLAYVAMALRRARSSQEALLALDRAFFCRRGWARTYVHRYAQSVGLTPDTLTSLFIACWVRQVTGLARRVANGGEDSRMAGGEITDWLRQDWRLAVWRHAVEHADRLDWEDLP